jgi:hypothetical protein
MRHTSCLQTSRKFRKWTCVKAVVCECYDVGKKIMLFHFPLEGRILVEKYVPDDCSVEVTDLYFVTIIRILSHVYGCVTNKTEF